MALHYLYYKLLTPLHGVGRTEQTFTFVTCLSYRFLPSSSNLRFRITILSLNLELCSVRATLVAFLSFSLETRRTTTAHRTPHLIDFLKPVCTILYVEYAPLLLLFASELWEGGTENDNRSMLECHGRHEEHSRPLQFKLANQRALSHQPTQQEITSGVQFNLRYISVFNILLLRN